MWIPSGAAVSAAALFVALSLSSAPGAEAAAPPPVHIGLVKTLFRDVPELLIPIGLRPMKDLMESQTGIPGELVPAGDAEDLARQICDDEMQFGVFHGVEFAWVRQHHPTLKPLVIAVNRYPSLRAHLIVRADSKIAAPAALQGKVVALPRMSREHCRLFLECRCCPQGQEPEKYFGQVSTPFDVEDALDDVVDDDEVAFEAYQKSKPGRAAKLKTLEQSEPFPCAVLAYDPAHVSEKTVQVFRDGLIGAKDNPKAQSLLKANRITGFEPVPADYDQELSDISKAYPQSAGK
jgi:ABC-type phosphate/phosphonate transport system substrate-binding protein